MATLVQTQSAHSTQLTPSPFVTLLTYYALNYMMTITYDIVYIIKQVIYRFYDSVQNFEKSTMYNIIVNFFHNHHRRYESSHRILHLAKVRRQVQIEKAEVTKTLETSTRYEGYSYLYVFHVSFVAVIINNIYSKSTRADTGREYYYSYSLFVVTTTKHVPFYRSLVHTKTVMIAIDTFRCKI